LIDVLEEHLPALDEKPAISRSTRLAIAKHVALQSLGAEEGGVLLNLESGEMYTVNETTLAFLEALNGKHTIGAIADRLVGVFEVEVDVLQSDLVDVAKDLVGESLLVVVAA
jgi:hypothetical protein